MAVELETLAVALVAETDDFKSGLDDADSTAKGWASSLGDSVGGLLKTGMMVGVGAVVAGVASIGAAAFNVSAEVHAAAGDMAASLGIPTEEAEKFAEVAKKIYGNNFADSVTDAADAVGILAKQMNFAADDPALQTATENAFRLRDAFGVDVADAVSAVTTLTENFGITSDEAFNMLAKGYQDGLDRSGDFLDTIGEYTVQFAEGGASAAEMFSLLDSGLQGGMLGTDKAADLFKEFRVRIQDGSSLTRDSLLAIGLDADTMSAQLADGSLTAVEAFNMVQRGLVMAQDSNVQFQAGVGLLGTQFEDLGAAVALNIDITEDWAEGGIASITALDAQYNTFGDAATGIWRKIVVAATPLTDALLDMVNRAMPAVNAALDGLVPIIEGVIAVIMGLTTIITGTDEPLGDWYIWWEKIAGIFGEDVADNILTVGEYLDDLRNTITGAFPDIQAAIGGALDYVTGMFTDHFGPAVEGGTGIMEYFKEWIDTNLPLVQTLFSNVLGAIQGFWDSHGATVMYIVENTFDTIFTVIDTVLRTVMDLITLTLQVLTGDWEGAWDTVLGIVERIWETIKTVIGNQLDSIWTAITSVDWMALGTSILQGIANGIAAGAQYIIDAAETAASNALDAAQDWLGIKSPSRVAADEIGVPFAEGVGVGMQRGLANLVGSIDSGMAELLNSMGGNYATPPVAQGGGNTFVINVSLSGSASYDDGRAVGAGVVAELRSRGYS